MSENDTRRPILRLVPPLEQADGCVTETSAELRRALERTKEALLILRNQVEETTILDPITREHAVELCDFLEADLYALRARLGLGGPSQLSKVPL